MSLSSGSILAGRYRLLAPHGTGQAGVELWTARDQRLDREVALTVVLGDRADPDTVSNSERVLRNAAYLGSPDAESVARVLDVIGPHDLTGEVVGLVAADSTPGWDLLESARWLPVPAAEACRILRPLAALVDRAHRTGLVAGVGDPRRIRITEEGELTLAFAGPGPATTTHDDVGGLGALLYLLLTGFWPGQPAPPLPSAPAGALIAPEQLYQGVPHELSMLTMLSLDGSGDSQAGGIWTIGPLLNALDRVLGTDGTPVTAPVPRVERAAPASPPPKPPKLSRNATRKKAGRGVVVGVLAAALTAIMILTLSQVAGSSGGQSAQPGPGIQVPAAPGPAAIAPAPELAAPAPPPPVPVEVTPVNVKEYNVTGSPDNPRRIGRAVDGDPGSGWSTSRYFQQLPKFTPGVGIMATFGRSVRLTTVHVHSPSAGTVVEIRSAPSVGASLSGTQLLATATLGSGTTAIPIPPGPPSTGVLVWITRLAGKDGGYQSTIDEVTYQAEG
jgi:hypothetical protein